MLTNHLTERDEEFAKNLFDENGNLGIFGAFYCFYLGLKLVFIALVRFFNYEK